MKILFDEEGKYHPFLFNTIPSKKGKKRQDWINNFKKKLGCSKCGYNKCAEVLHFHHIDNKDKLNATIIKSKPTWRVIEEIYKCIILCANCHIELHKEF